MYQRAHLGLLALLAVGSSLVSPACSEGASGLSQDTGTAGAAGAGGSGAAAGSTALGAGGSAGEAGAAGSGGTSSMAGSVADLPDSGSSASARGDAGTLPDPYVLLDFAGAVTSSEGKSVETWDLREKFTFDVSGSHTSSASVEVVNSQAQLDFAVANPDPFASGNVFQFVKIPTAAGDGTNWGGWAHIIFDLGDPLPQDLVLALPQWDNDNQVMIPGTKVIQLDIYYDDTVDPNLDWNTLLHLEHGNTDIWNSVAAQGYNVNLHLVNYANHANYAGAHDSGGIYIGYSAYLTQPNTWVTLTFTAVDEGRVSNFYSAASGLAALPSQITGIDIKPAGGYDPEDSNPVYLRNLRIVDAP